MGHWFWLAVGMGALRMGMRPVARLARGKLKILESGSRYASQKLSDAMWFTKCELQVAQEKKDRAKAAR